MKVLVNGGLNCSVLDGLWAEAYDPALGWAIGDGEVHATTTEGTQEHDAADAERLYTLLEREIIPEFYDRDAGGVPRAWTTRVRESMARLTPQFSANRCVREYTEQHYIPAAAAYQSRAAGSGGLARQLADWHHAIDGAWPSIRFGRVTIEAKESSHTFRAEVDLAGLDADSVAVELFADASTPKGAPMRIAMQRNTGAKQPGVTTYTAQAPLTRPASEFTVRITPHHASASSPLEDSRILWQH
jgi:starch phosphorylase